MATAASAASPWVQVARFIWPTNPTLFDGVFGISGCYSKTTPVGRQTAQLTLAARGGDAENMWGPYDSEAWLRHDTSLHPESLRETAVYLSAANGEYLFNADRDYSQLVRTPYSSPSYSSRVRTPAPGIWTVPWEMQE